MRKYLPPGNVHELYQFYSGWRYAHSIDAVASTPDCCKLVAKRSARIEHPVDVDEYVTTFSVSMCEQGVARSYDGTAASGLSFSCVSSQTSASVMLARNSNHSCWLQYTCRIRG